MTDLTKPIVKRLLMEYRRLKAPFTSVQIEPGNTHARLSIWVNHAKTGELTVRSSEVRDVLVALTDMSAAPDLRTRWGGDKVGVVVIEPAERGDRIADEVVLISEHGLICDAGDIRRSAGFGRPKPEWLDLR